ncbi:hypothetical protein Sphch_0734 [Sphingobium chlorophenolicum L-1]|uniref:Uncharacterized protein n=1 Tax=Sphingobium chlorophenolicum L-1 TaxID=690566 RepID=F6EZF3_SPHCR|nr:hypothetical protein [Sphingobium chlorophenolicum]AEG48429.1 hypothetical protein Sphch_0734 [Sphingobium chlorophenolicum L-1]
MRKLIAAALAATMPLAPATAATCWKQAAVEAAQIRDFEMMLMVSALRCRTTGNNFLASYNRLIREKRDALTQVNDELREHFRSAAGPLGALGAYDNYVTSLANVYGAGAEGLACRDLQSITDAANALPPTRSALLELADAAGISPHLSGARCDVVVAVAGKTQKSDDIADNEPMKVASRGSAE